MTQIAEFWDEQPPASELEWFYGTLDRARSQNGSSAGALPTERPWRAEPWAEFRDTSDEETRWLVDGLYPEGAFGFIAAPPKKGKTWLALYIAICLATGRPLFETYNVPAPTNVLYIALEGSRAALRARTGCLARGLGVDPEGADLERMSFLYRPRPFDLARSESAEWLEAQVADVGARFVVVDVLRAAARLRENSAEDFAVFRDYLEPMLRDGVTFAVLHHFGKLTDTQHERAPGERMSGTGAMYGALDVGLLITQSSDGARRLRIDVDARDFAAPDAIGIALTGTGTGEHGGFRYTDAARYEMDSSALDARDLVPEIETLFSDGKWRTKKEISDTKLGGIGANVHDVIASLTKHPERFANVHGPAVGRHSNASPWGTTAMRSRLNLTLDTHDTDEPSPDVGSRVSPPYGSRETHDDNRSGSVSSNTHDDTHPTIEF